MRTEGRYIVISVVAEALGEEAFKSAFEEWLAPYCGGFEDFSQDDDEGDWDERQLELPLGEPVCFRDKFAEEDDAPF